MIDDLRSMAVFVAVVGEGSFRAAAKRLALSPSVVSHHVSQLEKRLGCALLYRTTRHLSLTDDGRVFHEACARATPPPRTPAICTIGRGYMNHVVELHRFHWAIF